MKCLRNVPRGIGLPVGRTPRLRSGFSNRCAPRVGLFTSALETAASVIRSVTNNGFGGHQSGFTMGQLTSPIVSLVRDAAAGAIGGDGEVIGRVEYATLAGVRSPCAPTSPKQPEPLDLAPRTGD